MKKHKLTYSEISMLCLELSLFVHAGVDPGSGLVLLAEGADTPWLKQMLVDMARCMDEGAALSEAVEKTGAFPRDVWAMLRVAEATGRSEETLRSLAQYYDWRSELDQQMRMALLQPSALLLLMLAVITVLLVKVLPVFSGVYASLGGQLTGVAGGLLRLGQWLHTILPILYVLMAMMVLGLFFFAGAEEFRSWLQTKWERVRGSKNLSGKLAQARFAQALSMAFASGLTEEQALEMATDLLAEQPGAAESCRMCREKLADGEPLAGALRDTGLLPAAECRLLELGITSGSSETAAEEVARRMSRDAELAIEQSVGRIEPAMVTVTSVLVGAILLSVMLPLTHIMTAIG